MEKVDQNTNLNDWGDSDDEELLTLVEKCKTFFIRPILIILKCSVPV